MELENRIPALCRHMQEELYACGSTPSELMRNLGIHMNQWARWREGRTSPRVITWDAVEREYTKLTGQNPGGPVPSSRPDAPA